MSIPAKTFDEMVAQSGRNVTPFYKIGVVAAVLGIAASTLTDETKAGRLKCFLPHGRKQGRLFRGEWVDEWIEEGTRG